MKIKLTFAGAMLLMLCIACNHMNSEQAMDVDNTTTASGEMFGNGNIAVADSTTSGNEIFKEEEQKGTQDQKQQPPKQQQQPSNQPAANPEWDKKIIKTATLNIEVDNYEKYYSVLRECVRNAGGYVAGENQTQSDYKLENTVTVKVPVARFDEAMNLLASGTGKDKVVERRVTSQDVTGEVVDTRSRMEAKRQVRLRYMELLNQAKTMEDILKVQDEINQVQEQIELGAGRVNYLHHASAYSTIQLTIFQVLNPAAEEPKDPSFATRIWYAFEKGWSFIKNIMIALITIWPLLLAAFGIWLIVRKMKFTKVKV
jgi:hypothetical protein